MLNNFCNIVVYSHFELGPMRRHSNFRSIWNTIPQTLSKLNDFRNDFCVYSHFLRYMIELWLRNLCHELHLEIFVKMERALSKFDKSDGFVVAI